MLSGIRPSDSLGSCFVSPSTAGLFPREPELVTVVTTRSPSPSLPLAAGRGLGKSQQKGFLGG